MDTFTNLKDTFLNSCFVYRVSKELKSLLRDLINSRADSESKMSYTYGSNPQRFGSYEFLRYSK